MAGLGRYPALGFNVPQKLKPNPESCVGFYTVVVHFH